MVRYKLKNKKKKRMMIKASMQYGSCKAQSERHSKEPVQETAIKTLDKRNIK